MKREREKKGRKEVTKGEKKGSKQARGKKTRRERTNNRKKTKETWNLKRESEA